MRDYSKEEQQKYRHLVSDQIKFCGCGHVMWPLIKHLLEIAEDHDAHGSFYDDGGSKWPWKEFAAKTLDSWGLTEHGTGIGYAWLTPEGEDFLAFLRDAMDEDGELPEFTHTCEIDEQW